VGDRLETTLAGVDWPADIAQKVAGRYSAVCAHPVYSEIDSLPKLRVFMEHHVWAVWDFMTLLKSVQADICPSKVPWMPPADPEGSRLINDAVLEEESGLWMDGKPLSHFEWYLRAMQAVGADDKPIRSFLSKFADRVHSRPLLKELAPAPSAAFTETTIRLSLRSLPVKIAALCLGREQLVPEMFPLFEKRLSGLPEAKALEPLIYYLKRHTEIDGDSHGPATARLLEKYCKGSREAALGALDALESRNALWDALLDKVRSVSPAVR
jgi:hypothetical protein